MALKAENVVQSIVSLIISDKDYHMPTERSEEQAILQRTRDHLTS